MIAPDGAEEPPTPVRVLLADDHEPVRRLVRTSLSGNGFEVVAEATSADEAVAGAVDQHPDVCLLDIRMPGGGIEAARQISRALPDVAVVMLTVSREDDDLFDALKAGARGYLLKGGAPDRLAPALLGVLRGEAALPRELTARVIEEFSRRDRRRLISSKEGRPARLTAKEWEVLDGLRDGLTTAEIAVKMFVAPVTVRTHVAAILRKLQVRSRDEAVRLLGDDQP